MHKDIVNLFVVNVWVDLNMPMRVSTLQVCYNPAPGDGDLGEQGLMYMNGVDSKSSYHTMAPEGL